MNAEVCRKDTTYRHPACHWCIWHELCAGPIVARTGYYSYYNCPAEPDTGGVPQPGKFEEYAYCKDASHCHR